jgi:hypothetical protein
MVFPALPSIRKNAPSTSASKVKQKKQKPKWKIPKGKKGVEEHDDDEQGAIDGLVKLNI